MDFHLIRPGNKHDQTTVINAVTLNQKFVMESGWRGRGGGVESGR